MNKTSLRFFNDIPVRSVWDDETKNVGSAQLMLSQHLSKPITREFIGRQSREEIPNCLQIANN